jgi:exodeoxyribonuclease VII small subunit
VAKREKASGDADRGESAAPSFEHALAEVERAVQRLETGEIDLAEALEAFEAGVRHLKICYRRLEETERRIERICGVDAQGNAVVEDFDEESLSLEQKQQARSRRRSHGSSPPRGAPRDRTNGVDDDQRLF